MFNFFKKESPPLINKQYYIIDVVKVWDLADFLKSALMHYQANQESSKGFLVNQYEKEINLLEKILEQVGHFSKTPTYFAIIELVNDIEIIEDEETLLKFEISCENLIKIIQFETLEQGILQQKYQQNDKASLVLLCCEKIDFFKKTWTYLNGFRTTSPDKFQKSYVTFKINYI